MRSRRRRRRCTQDTAAAAQATPAAEIPADIPAVRVAERSAGREPRSPLRSLPPVNSGAPQAPPKLKPLPPPQVPAYRVGGGGDDPHPDDLLPPPTEPALPAIRQPRPLPAVRSVYTEADDGQFHRQRNTSHRPAGAARSTWLGREGPPDAQAEASGGPGVPAADSPAPLALTLRMASTLHICWLAPLRFAPGLLAGVAMLEAAYLAQARSRSPPAEIWSSRGEISPPTDLPSGSRAALASRALRRIRTRLPPRIHVARPRLRWICFVGRVSRIARAGAAP